MGFIRKGICFIGFIAFFRFLYYVYKEVYAWFHKPVDIKKKYKSNTVIITGASSGVGKELAKLCSKQGLNIIGVGRSSERLQQVAQDCEKNGIKFTQVVQDLSDSDAAANIFGNIKGTRAGALFICHGHNNFGRLIEKTEEEIRADITADITSTDLLINKFMNQAEGNGTVTFVSSMNSFTFSPYAQLYGSCKRAINHFFAHMQTEGASKGITFTVLNPGYIESTEFNRTIPKEAVSSSKGLKPEKVAEIILGTAGANFEADIGLDCILVHGLQWLLPQSIIDYFVGGVCDKMMAKIDASKKKSE